VAPAAAVTLPKDAVKALRADATVLTPVKIVRKRDTMRSCQAGDHRPRTRTATANARETQRQSGSVACEQPPRSELNFSNGLKSAQAAAVAAVG
jgi:hypothetical protein